MPSCGEIIIVASQEPSFIVHIIIMYIHDIVVLLIVVSDTPKPFIVRLYANWSTAYYPSALCIRLNNSWYSNICYK